MTMRKIATHFGLSFLPAMVVGLLLATSAVQAQYADTFYVSVAEKTPEHPYYNVGYNEGYVVNGRQSPTIILVRDSLYLFDTHEVPQSLVLLFYTIPIGGTQGTYSDFVKESKLSQGIRILKASNETPDTLYYASSRQPWMGGMILIVDSLTSSVEESKDHGSRVAGMQAAVSPNPFTEEAELRFVLDDRSHVRVDVLNTLGQVVGTQDAGLLEPGEKSVRLDASALPSGLYLYRVEALSERRRSVATGTLQILR